MSLVYRALDRETQEWGAIKLLLPKYIDKPEIRHRFATEAKAMMSLRHRNVIHVFDVNNTTVQPFFAMEMAEGGCVLDWLAQYGAMPPRMAVDIAIQVCKGLGAAHRHGVVHRDVKPHNILINRWGVCKITDFGIAPTRDTAASLLRTGSIMGTLGYIAPEQRANAKVVDERCDIYAVGATLFTMVTGRTTMDLFFADQEPDILEGVQEILKPLIIEATRYRREDRHQTMRDLTKALYVVMDILPEDPSDTPPLVLFNPVEHSEHLIRLASSESTKNPLGNPNTANSDHFETWNDTAQPSAPNIPRQTLLRDRPQQPNRRYKKLGKQMLKVLFGTSPLLVLVLLAVGIAVSGRKTVQRAQASFVETNLAFDEMLESESVIVDELIRLGANQAVTQRVWTEGINTPERIPDMTQNLRETLDSHEPNPSSPLMHHARTAQNRLERIDVSYAEWTQTRRSLQQIEASTPAQMATKLGLL
ncbi:MAG: protein kinase [Rhodobacterales bacterium]|nr:protein kinase [Rhodobacterales bacterium]